ncbi:unnamed protein product [Linum tenue]|uniref:Uncharacterized protein n=1 Tax=Linum tenue TaxID=586396 RepID=A0AAV0MZ01_9ROSI|nr:unnamed protein product [Linum tenue]
MVASCLRNHHSFRRIMNVHTLIQLIGHLESKVLRSPKDHLRLFGLSYSPRNSKHDIGSLHMHQRVVKEVLHLRMQLQTNEMESLLLMALTW